MSDILINRSGDFVQENEEEKQILEGDNKDSEEEEEVALNKDSLMLQTLFSIVVNTMFGYFFYFYTTNEEFATFDEDCDHMSSWGVIFSWVCISFAAFRLLLNMPLIFLDPEEENPICISGVFRTTAWVEIIISVVFYLAFSMIYTENEPCGGLRKVVFVYLMFVTTMVILFIVLSTILVCYLKETFGNTVCTYLDII